MATKKNKAEELNQFRFQLSGLEIEQFAVLNEKPDLVEQLFMDNEFNFGADIKDRVVSVQHVFSFSDGQSPLLKLAVIGYFQFSEEDWQRINTEKQIELPKSLASHLAAIITGTTRGALCAKTAGTPWATRHLLLLDIHSIFPESVKLIKSALTDGKEDC